MVKTPAGEFASNDELYKKPMIAAEVAKVLTMKEPATLTVGDVKVAFALEAKLV